MVGEGLGWGCEGLVERAVGFSIMSLQQAGGNTDMMSQWIGRQQNVNLKDMQI